MKLQILLTMMMAVLLFLVAIWFVPTPDYPTQRRWYHYVIGYGFFVSLLSLVVSAFWAIWA